MVQNMNSLKEKCVLYCVCIVYCGVCVSLVGTLCISRWKSVYLSLEVWVAHAGNLYLTLKVCVSFAGSLGGPRWKSVSYVESLYIFRWKSGWPTLEVSVTRWEKFKVVFNTERTLLKHRSSEY